MPKPTSKSAKDWRDLKKGTSPQKARRKPMSWRARFRSVWIWTKRTAALALLGGAIYGGYYLYENTYFEEIFGRDTREITRIEFKTDGAISGAWLNKYLKIPRGAKLSEVNIFALKQSLDALSQVKSSKVERVYPDVLRIAITEHKPMAKIMLNVDFENRIYLMSSDGFFFLPVCIEQDLIDKLLFVRGIKISFDGKVPANYDKSKKIEEFINAIKSRMPAELSKWNSIDVSELQSRTLPLITATTRDDVNYIFEPQDYPKQLDRLEYILRYLSENPLNNIEKIDLTLKDWSVVKFIPKKTK